MAGPRLRLAILVVAVGALFVLVATGLPHSPEAMRDALPLHGVELLVVVVVAWIVLTPMLVSATPLALATGLLFGTALGTCTSIVGATIGGAVAFLLARRLGHAGVESLGGRRLEALQERLARRGFTAVLLARIAPAPATVLHYAAGVSRIRLAHFAPAIALGGVPRHFAYAALGSSGGDLGSPPAIAALALLGVITVATGVIAWRRRSAPAVAPA